MSDSSLTICLTMIVRNEAPVIQRCLSAVLPIIDYWVIVDTGSTDGTQQIIEEYLKHIPGELIERPWVNFGHNRTEALSYARGNASYMIMIDADEVLEVTGDFRKMDLAADAYMVDAHYGSLAYVRKQLLRSDLSWRYEGVLHEYPVCDNAKSEELATGLRINVYHDGARARDPQTYRRDAILLESVLLSEPDNTRYVFYLAQSYRDAGDFELAARNYKRRFEMGGWEEECWFSLYQIACLHERMGYAWSVVMQEYLAAFQFTPDRAEPLYRIGMHCQRTGEFHLARLFFSLASQLPYPSSRRLFIEKDLYQYQLPLECAAACGYAGDHEQAIVICNRLLRSGLLPPDHRERVLEIRRSSVQRRLARTGMQAAPGSMKVFIPFRDPPSEFDDCIESLLLQNSDSFEVIFIDDGSQADHADRIPLDCPGFCLLRNDTSIGFEACLDHFIATQCGPNDIIIPMDYASRFASRNVLRRIQRTFEEEGVQLLYGQFRLPNGKMGDAEPAVNESDFLRRLAALASQSLIIFRAQVWKERYSPIDEENQQHEENPNGTSMLDRTLFDCLMKAAGFQGTLYSDDIFTVVGNSLPESKGVRSESQVEGGTAPFTKTVFSEFPKVSCLMVTHDRLNLAKRAIRCYAYQSYPNRELVIVSDGELRIRRGLERFVVELGLESVRFIYPDREGLTLGQLRNVAHAAAAGEILCQWDDDDCYHPDRIRVQVEHMLKNNGRACYLTDHLQFLDEDRALVWVDWTLGGRSGKDQLLPGTLVMFKDDRFRYPESGPFSQRGEDSILLYKLCDTVPVVAAKGLGYLYLYTYHGRNTFDRDHHYRLSAFGRTISALEKEKELICRAMAHYPVAKPYLAVGCDGPAFMLDD